jgi:glycosyltransferase involved in cell wall biosynthesis
MKKIKIMHIMWSGGTGGGERFIRDISAYSNRKRYEHSVCFLSRGGPIADQIACGGTQVYCLGMKSGLSIVVGAKIIGVIGKIKPDIVTIHSRNYFIPLLLLFFPKIRKSCFEHGGRLDGNISKRDTKIYRHFYNWFVRFYPLILTNSDYMKNKIVEVTKIKPQKIRVYYYGIDINKYENDSANSSLKAKLDIPGSHRVFGMVGRLAEQKGVDDFIKIASEIQKLSSQCSFVVIGDGHLRANLEKMAMEYKVDIKFLGDRQDVPELLSVFDVFIFTSRWEPFGIVVLEAFAAKVPIVGFSVPGMKEIIEKGGGGILIKGRDHCKVAKIAVDLLEDKKRYSELSDEGHLNVQKNFSVQKTIKILEEEYSLLLEKGV